MYLLSDVDFSLPLHNPVIIFSLVLFIILFAPILFNKFRLPHIIGLILAGVIVGPHGTNLLLRDSSIVLLATVGLLYIMFTAGLEIDLEEFRKNRGRSLVFGLYTFLIPMLLGTAAAYYLLGFSLPSALLLASMFAAHTLLAYPITSKYGISRLRAVTFTIGGTIIADILALLVLAGVTGMVKGDISTGFWLRLAFSTLLFGATIFFVFPLIAQRFFKSFGDAVSQYIFVLAIVFLGAFLAELAGLEHIIGAFLAGLALNRFIPHDSPLMNRINFVGNAFFIPFFLISVGMLVDFGVLFKGFGAIKVAIVMTVLAVLSKYLAAVAAQKTFRLSADEMRLIFGLSTARVGATLAVVLVGYNIIIGETAVGEPIRLLNEDVLNGTVIMILITCTISSFVTEKTAQRMALDESNVMPASDGGKEAVLLSLAYTETVSDLVDFGLMLKSHDKNIPVYALNIISDEQGNSGSKLSGQKLMQKALAHAGASGHSLLPLSRHDISISNGIVYTLKEHHCTDLVIGLHHEANAQNFLGGTAERILHNTVETVYIYRCVQPFNTLRRMVVAITPRAELEPGFPHWIMRLHGIARSSGVAISFYGMPKTLKEVSEQPVLQKADVNTQYHVFQSWDDFLIFTREVKADNLLVIVSSRKGHVSYQPALEKLPHYLSNYFTGTSFVLLYPQQVERGIQMDDVQFVDSSLAETFTGTVAQVTKAGGFWKRLFGTRKN